MATEESAHLGLAKRLAHSSNKEIRDAAFLTMSTWLDGHKGADESEYLKLWKALFYCVWYSDKVPIQQELIFNISRLTRKLHDDHTRAVRFLRAFFSTIFREWMGLDHHRLDKYLSLIRRMVHETLVLITSSKWNEAVVRDVLSMLSSPVLSSEPNGVRYHVADVLLDEIETAMPNITTEQLRTLLVPFYRHAISTDDKFLFERIFQEVLQALIPRVAAAQASVESVGKASEDSGKVLSAVLIDADERIAAAKKAWRKVNVRDIGKDIFCIAAYPETQISHREKLYALHKEYVHAALDMKQASNEKELLPSPLSAVTTHVRDAALLVNPKAAPKVECSDTAATAVSGTKRKRTDTPAAAETAPEKTPKKGRTTDAAPKDTTSKTPSAKEATVKSSSTKEVSAKTTSAKEASSKSTPAAATNIKTPKATNTTAVETETPKLKSILKKPTPAKLVDGSDDDDEVAPKAKSGKKAVIVAPPKTKSAKKSK